MTYRSIATILNDPLTATDMLAFAIQAARQWGAHLHVLCTGIDSTDPGFYYAGAQAIAVQQNLEVAQGDAQALEGIAQDVLRNEDILWDLEAVTLMAGGIGPFLTDHMRFFDLAILPLPYGEGRSFVDVSGFEACLFGADIPVLVAPAGAQMGRGLSRMMIAWDDGAEALAAAKAARPLASAARLCEICIINPDRHGPDRSDPGGRLAQLLSREGAHVEVTVMARNQDAIAAQLLQRAGETGADLLVMGAYGHSRLREAVMGGVTRSVLRDASLPVLMAR